MTEPSPSRQSPLLRTIEGALSADVYWGWPDAALVHTAITDHGTMFWIRADGSQYRLIVGRRAMEHAEKERDATGLLDALRAQDWMNFLLTHECGYLAMAGEHYILQAC